MHDMHMMDELDFSLVNALQLSPRASWAQLEPILDTDSSTLSRRWARLVSEGLAWSSLQTVSRREWSTMPEGVCALVEIVCVAGQREKVIQQVSALPEALSVECTSGARELVVMLALPSITQIDRCVSMAIATLPGVLGTRTHVARRCFLDGAGWRLGMLRKDQERRIKALANTLDDSPFAPSPLLLKVAESLGADARRPAASIAEEIGSSTSTVNRAIGQLMRADWVRTRVEIAHDVVGYNASTLLWFTVPHAQLEGIASAIALMPETRMCYSVVGASNLMVLFWLKELEQLDSLETRIARLFPSAVVNDRWMILRHAKRVGHLMDSQGYHSGHVPFERHPQASRAAAVSSAA